MKKNLFVLCTLILCILCFSCSNLYQDFTTTTVELTPEFIKMSRNTAADDPNFFIYVCLQCENKTQTKTVDITEILEADGVTLQFDKLPVGKTGTLYVSVGSKKVKSELEAYYSENIAELDGKTQFRVQPNGNTKIKVSLKENEERFFADFLTFPYNEESPISNIELNFTEYSTITAPLPIGTTRWQIYHNDMTYLGSFGEKIDVKKELMNYKNYFNYQGEGKPIFVNLQGTGESLENIKTPIVYSSFDSTPGLNAPYLYNFANSLDKVGGNTEPLFNLSSELTDYCFDNAGNLYYIRDECAFKLAYDFDTNSYESAIIDGEFCNPFYSYPDISAQEITYDKAQNTLYLLTYETTGGDTNLVKFSNPAGTIYKSKYYNSSPISLDYSLFYPNNDNSTYLDYNWNIDNNILYLTRMQQITNWDVNSYEYTYKLVIKSYNLENQETQTAEYTILSNTSTSLSGNTDTMYQDGSLYVIFRCYNTYWSNGDDKNYSTGGIIKYDISSQTFDDDFGIKGFATEYSFGSKFEGKDITINYFAPTLENETQVFYGPTKFVAIMPKKLVFLDQGANVKDKGDGSLSTQSRIVEYDLLTNTFSSKEFPGKILNFSYSYSQ